MKASPLIGARNSVVAMSRFYSKKKEERSGQRRSDETGDLTTARVKQATLGTNMVSDKYSNSPSDSIDTNSFQTDNHSVFMPTDPFHIENNGVDPKHLDTGPRLDFTATKIFEKQLESIDHDLRKYDIPMHTLDDHMSPITIQPSHMPPQPILTHPYS